MVRMSVALRTVEGIVDAVFHSRFVLSQSLAANQASWGRGSDSAHLHILKNQLSWYEAGKSMRGTESLAVFQGTRCQ
jgi:hypothetical protein